LPFQAFKESFIKKQRVHSNGSFVLICEINKEEKIVPLLDFDLHDNTNKK